MCDPEDAPESDLLAAWIRESYCVLAPKTLSRQVGDG